MRDLRAWALIFAAGFLAGCTNYNVGAKPDADNNGSYPGATLNPPVADQNPEPGSDPSFPSADQTTDHPPPDKIDNR